MTLGGLEATGTSAVGLVIVSHSPHLARCAVEMTQEILPGLVAPHAVVAGNTAGGLGTDATEVAGAIMRLIGAGCEDVLILCDIGSSVMSADMARDFLAPGLAGRTHLSEAPLLEGLVAAWAASAVGLSLDLVRDRTAQAATLKADQVRALR